MGLSHEDLALQLYVTPHTIRTYESYAGNVPNSKARQISDLKNKMDAQPPLAEEACAGNENAFSWEPGVFNQYVWKRAHAKADEMVGEVTLRAIPFDPKDVRLFGEAKLRMDFKNLEVASQPFSFDHMGGDWEFDPKAKDRLWDYCDGQTIATYKLSVIRRYSSEDYKEGIAYEIPPGSYPEMKIYLQTQQKVPLDAARAETESQDAPKKTERKIGFPLYSDLAVRKLTIRLRLQGLHIPTSEFNDLSQPEAEAKAYPIRRSLLQDAELYATPLSVDLLQVIEEPDGSSVIQLGPLINPVGGYFYAIAWPLIERVQLV